ncbi:MAG: DUF424 domain-containing protein [Candidatus Micrarchaeota archaeon]
MKSPSSKVTAKTHRKTSSGVTKTIIALCDSELLGKIFEKGDTALDLKNYRAFYEGSVVSELQAMELLKKADNANIVGKKSVEIARKALGFPSESVKKIGGVPHLQYYKI